jgi:hypothetical protein
LFRELAVTYMKPTVRFVDVSVEDGSTMLSWS